jgi:hypothetical protein
MKVICTLGVLSQHIASHQLLPFSLPLLPEAYFANNQDLGLVQSPIGRLGGGGGAKLASQARRGEAWPAKLTLLRLPDRRLAGHEAATKSRSSGWEEKT